MLNKKALFVGVAMVSMALLSVPAANAQAAPPDPQIRQGGGHGSIAITSPDFVIVSSTGSSPNDGTPCLLIQHGVTTAAPSCFFINKIMEDDGQTGATIKGVIFLVNKASITGALSCALDTLLGGPSPWFSKCTVAPYGIPVVGFSGGPGIPYGGDFSFGFRGFNPNATFYVFSLGAF